MVDFKAVQDKWQKEWEEKEVFRTDEDHTKKKFYCLEMFPYPSASFLHMGHVRNYSIGDAIARFKRLQGFNVLYPMGYDSFGLPAENAAKKEKTHPREYTEGSIAKIKYYMKQLGLSYDWDRMIATHRPEYYQWNQYFFIKFFEKGLVYRKKAAVNYCDSCNTVLANEEVEEGKCWRCGSEVVQKELDQWFFKTTAYVDELLNDISKLHWSQRIKSIQENWIGKSYGTMVNFTLDDSSDFPIFTTRPDTIYGVTFMVIALNHPKLKGMVAGTQYEKPVNNFIAEVKKAQEAEDMDFLEKSGVFTGRYVTNPLNNEKIPLYAGNFVVADYATGCIMAVPAHDQRDYEFAKKYKIPIKQVILPIFGESHQEDIERKTITAIVHDKKTNKFLYLKWKNQKWISPVIGGIDEGETAEEAAEREVFEETGYKVKAVRKLGFQFQAHFYADHKHEHRKRIDQPVLLELLDENPSKVTEHEHTLHEVVWFSADEAKKYTTHDYNLIGLRAYLEGESAYVENGILINSGDFNGISNRDAIEKITAFIESKKWGAKTVQYKLKDWLISRQRYWGTPIPMIHCATCGVVPLDVEELPLLLPEDVTFDTPGNPLLTSKSFAKALCPKCRGPARRETDTMGGFMDSSWYFLRYCDAHNARAPFDKDKVHYWMPVDQYVGGIEHAVGHLIYSRFFTKALRDMDMLDIDEPFNALFNQGVVYKNGKRMSKSQGNAVTQDEVAAKYGIDTARVFLLLLAAPDKDIEFSETGIEGTYKFLLKAYKLCEDHAARAITAIDHAKDAHVTSKMHLTIRELTGQMNEFKLNNAVLTLMEYTNYLFDEKEHVSQEVLGKCLAGLAILLNPFAPHLSEECHALLGGKGFASLSSWPMFDESQINASLHFMEKVIENTARDIRSVLELAKIEKPQEITLIIADAWKYALTEKIRELNTRNIGELTKHIMGSAFKVHGQEIMKILPKIVDKIPEERIDQHAEIDAFTASSLGATFNCTITVLPAEKSREPKARQALPAKPAIIAK